MNAINEVKMEEKDRKGDGRKSNYKKKKRKPN